MEKDVLSFLKQIRGVRFELITAQRTYEEIRAMLMPSGSRYDRDRVQTSPEDRMPGAVAELLEIEKKQKELETKLLKEILTAEQLLEEMQTSEHRELLKLRYMAGGRVPLTWEQVAERMHYSPQHVRGKLHGRAIREARRVWKKMEREDK